MLNLTSDIQLFCHNQAQVQENDFLSCSEALDKSLPPSESQFTCLWNEGKVYFQQLPLGINQMNLKKSLAYRRLLKW
jgi:hypothetical protein